MQNNNAKDAVSAVERRRLLRPGYIIPLALIILSLVIALVLQDRSTENLHSAYRVTMDTSVDLQFAHDNRGPETGMLLLESLPGVEGLLITPELDILLSSGLEDLVELND